MRTDTDKAHEEAAERLASIPDDAAHVLVATNNYGCRAPKGFDRGLGVAEYLFYDRGDELPALAAVRARLGELNDEFGRHQSPTLFVIDADGDVLAGGSTPETRELAATFVDERDGGEFFRMSEYDEPALADVAAMTPTELEREWNEVNRLRREIKAEHEGGTDAAEADD